MKHIYIVIFLLCSVSVFSQSVLKVTVKDRAQIVISGAIVSCAQTRVLTDASGTCIIKDSGQCKTLQLHKLGFSDTTIQVPSKKSGSDTIYLSVFLRFNPIYLPEVSVSTSEAEELNPLKADFILDYELCGNFLVTLLSNDYVVVSDVYNSVMSHSKPLDGVTGIERDAFGYNYLVTDARAYMFAADSNDVRIDMKWKEKNVLVYLNTYVDQVLDSAAIMRKFGDINQTITFFVKPTNYNKPLSILKTIGNDERANAVKAYAAEATGLAQYVNELELTKMTANTRAEIIMVRAAQNMADMLEMVYALPAYNLARLVNDSLYLFAHDLDSIFVYDKNCTLKRGMRMSYHHLKTWDKELIVNEEKTKVYAKLLYNAKPALAEVDLKTGTLSSNITALDCSFATKIRIKNSKAYFMSKQKNGSGRSIYTQPIN